MQGAARLVQGVDEEDQPARLVSLPHVEPRHAVEVHRPHGRREGEEVGRTTRNLAGPGLAQLRKLEPRSLSRRGPRHPQLPPKPDLELQRRRRGARPEPLAPRAPQRLARRSAVVEPSARARRKHPPLFSSAALLGRGWSRRAVRRAQGAVVRGGGEGEVREAGVDEGDKGQEVLPVESALVQRLRGAVRREEDRHASREE
mmetsp:Transcript_39165/g.129669  ORF Transcript_39165/g.129669 Transcript_39165/m.129669 type:complete len:201 (-) Transcript_39165:165-767(-)